MVSPLENSYAFHKLLLMSFGLKWITSLFKITSINIVPQMYKMYNKKKLKTENMFNIQIYYKYPNKKSTEYFFFLYSSLHLCQYIQPFNNNGRFYTWYTLKIADLQAQCNTRAQRSISSTTSLPNIHKFTSCRIVRYLKSLTVLPKQ